MNVAEAIRSLRVSAGLKQRELAERVGVTASMLSYLEAGKREPTIQMLRDLARALEMPSSVLFAVALAEDDRPTNPTARHLRSMTETLLKASQHALAARHAADARRK
jgi:transcriptional regulator with XRE-family HTH domain